MAQWVNAKLGDILPSEVSSIITSIEGMLSVVNDTLAIVRSGLVLGQLIAGLDFAFDLMSALRETIKSFKNEFAMSGIYWCDMLDYPTVQLSTKRGKGPTWDYTKVAFGGQEFKNSFVRDLAASFYDSYDIKRPQFSADCSMLVIVAGMPTLEDLGLFPGESNPFLALAGLGTSAKQASQKIRRICTNCSFNIARDIAEKQEATTVGTRVKRVMEAFKSYASLSEDEADSVLVPFDPITGKSFFMQALSKDTNGDYTQIDASKVSWDQDVLPFLISTEMQKSLSTYPDWSNKTLKEIAPELVDAINLIFDPVIDLLSAGIGISSAIKQLIVELDKKIAYLQDIIDQIESVLERIDVLLNMSGFSALFINTKYGVEDIRLKLLNATDVPFSGNGFYSGFALLTGGVQVTAFNLLLAPIGT